MLRAGSHRAGKQTDRVLPTDYIAYLLVHYIVLVQGEEMMVSSYRRNPGLPAVRLQTEGQKDRAKDKKTNKATIHNVKDPPLPSKESNKRTHRENSLVGGRTDKKKQICFVGASTLSCFFMVACVDIWLFKSKDYHWFITLLSLDTTTYSRLK